MIPEMNLNYLIHPTNPILKTTNKMKTTLFLPIPPIGSIKRSMTRQIVTTKFLKIHISNLKTKSNHIIIEIIITIMK